MGRKKLTSITPDYINFNIKVPKELKEKFVSLARQNESDASKEVRRFMKSFCDKKEVQDGE